ncbi:MAG: hypothetical protein HFI34_10620 [Lachnospiraceae bacterium]|nr:hypothetical protein [Lachnospiraceae bacterium]
MKKKNCKWIYGFAIIIVLFSVSSVMFFLYSNRYSSLIHYFHELNENDEMKTSDDRLLSKQEKQQLLDSFNHISKKHLKKLEKHKTVDVPTDEFYIKIQSKEKQNLIYLGYYGSEDAVIDYNGNHWLITCEGLENSIRSIRDVK